MEKLKSRKFWMAIATAILLVLREGLGWDIPTDTVMGFVAVVLGWIFAEAYVDGKHAECDKYEVYDFEIDDL